VRAHGFTPLSLAAALGRIDVARRLLQLDADVNSPFQRSPWLVAARHGTAEMVELMMLSGRVNRTDMDKNGHNAAFLAAENRNVGVMWLMIAFGVDWAELETIGLLRACQGRGRPRRRMGDPSQRFDSCPFCECQSDSSFYKVNLDDRVKTPWFRAVMNNNLDAVLAMCAGLVNGDVLPTPFELLQIAVSAQPTSRRSVWWAANLTNLTVFTDTDELPVHMQHWLFGECYIDIDSVTDLIQDAESQTGFFKARAFEVCIGLQSLNLSVLETCEILANVLAPFELLVPLHLAWRVVAAVKHLRPRRFRSLPKRYKSSTDDALLLRLEKEWNVRDNWSAWSDDDNEVEEEAAESTASESSSDEADDSLAVITERAVSETDSETEQNGSDTDESSLVFENAASDEDDKETSIEDVLSVSTDEDFENAASDDGQREKPIEDVLWTDPTDDDEGWNWNWNIRNMDMAELVRLFRGL
jgi:hypothetical protein